MGSDILTPAQIAEIAERCRCDAAEGSEQTASDEYCAKCGEPVDVRHGSEWAGGFSWCDVCSQEFAEAMRADIPLLLSHAAAQAARIEEMEKALREIDSNRGGEANTAYALHRKLIQSANIARTALEKP